MKTSTRKKISGLALGAALALCVAGHAEAGPSLGAPRPDVRLVDAWDRALSLGALAGKPVLVLYEDKASTTQNLALKQELSELAKGGKYKSRIGLVAIADLSAYDYWPVKGFVKDAVRDESHKQGLPIYCDWNGEARRTMGLVPGVSNVVLYGPNGRVRFSRSGPLTSDERRALIEQLRGFADGR